MSIAIYEVSIPVFKRGILTLSRLLDKAASQANRRGYPVDLLLHSRFYPDMYPLSQQIARIAEIPLEVINLLTHRQEDSIQPIDFTDFSSHLKALANTLTVLNDIQPQHLAAATVQPVESVLAGESYHYTDGLQYLQQQAIPNFYFHLTTAYNLLRHNGVDLKKADYLGY